MYLQHKIIVTLKTIFPVSHKNLKLFLLGLNQVFKMLLEYSNVHAAELYLNICEWLLKLMQEWYNSSLLYPSPNYLLISVSDLFPSYSAPYWVNTIVIIQ